LVECLSKSDVNNKNDEQATEDSDYNKGRLLLDVVGNLFALNSCDASGVVSNVRTSIGYIALRLPTGVVISFIF
jgi:hypothetical protein